MCVSITDPGMTLKHRDLTVWGRVATKNTKNIILSYLSDLTFVSDREGIDNPFIALVARFLFVCVGARDLSVASYWIDTLVLKN